MIIYTAASLDKYIQKAYNKFQRLEGEITLGEKKLFYLKTILSKAGEINSEYDAFFAGRSAARDSDKLLQDINSIARRLNVNIINIKPSLINDEAKFKAFSIKIESQDDVATLAKFLYALTEEQKNIGVERLQLKAQGKEELPRISLLLNAIAFKD